MKKIMNKEPSVSGGVKNTNFKNPLLHDRF